MPNPTVVPLTIGIKKEPKGARLKFYSEDQKFYKLKDLKDAPKDSVLYVPQESYVVFEHANPKLPFKFVATDGAGTCAAIAITGNGKTFFTHLDEDSNELGKVKDNLNGMINKMLDMVSLDHSKIESISISSGNIGGKGNTMPNALVEAIKARDDLGTVDKPCTLSSSGDQNLTLDLAKMEVVCCSAAPFPAIDKKAKEQIVNKNAVELNDVPTVEERLELLGKYKFPDDVASKLTTTGKTITIMDEVIKEIKQQNNNANAQGNNENENEDENNESNEESSSLNNDLIDAGGNENSSDISQGSKHATTGSNSENVNTGTNVTPNEPKDVNEEEELELVESK